MAVIHFNTAQLEIDVIRGRENPLSTGVVIILLSCWRITLQAIATVP